MPYPYVPPITGSGTSQAMAAAAQADAINGAIDDAVAAEATARASAIGTAIATEVTNRDAAISTHGTAEVTARNSAISSAVASEATARDAAIASHAATEVTARTAAIGAAIATEVTNRDAAIATHGAAEVTARTAAISTAVAAEATARTSAIATAVAEQAVAWTAADQVLRGYLGAAAIRPGEAGEAFVSGTVGAPDTLASITATSGVSLETVTGLGVVAIVDHVATLIASRTVWAVYPGRVYRAHAYVQRLNDAADPAGNVVRLALRRLNASFSDLGISVLSERVLRVVDGRWHLTATFGIAATGPDDGTVYVRPYVECFTADHRTAIAQLEIVDISEVAAIEGALDVVAITDAVAAADADAASAAISAAAAALAAAGTAADKAATQAARDAVLAGAPGYYADTTAGLAAVPLNGYFAVPVTGSNDAVILYRETAGPVATEITRLPSTALVTQMAQDVGANAVNVRDARARGTTRDGRSGHWWGVFDKSGKVALGLDALLRWNLQEIFHSAAQKARDGNSVEWFVKDVAGRLGLGLTRAGEVALNGIVYVTKVKLRDGQRFIFWIKDEVGNVAFGIRRDGSLYLAGIESAWLGYLSPAAFTALYRVFNVRQFGGFALASRTEWGATFDVRKPTGISAPVIDMPDQPITFLPVYGQSNAGYSSDTALPSMLDALYPASALHFNLRDAYGTTAVSDAALNALQPARDLTANGTLATTLMAHENACRELDGQPTPGVIGWTAWYGGQPITTFVRGTVPWNNLLAGARAAATRAADYDRSIVCPSLIFVQGESTTSGYQAALEALADDLMPEMQTQMDLAAEPKMVVVQVNTASTGSPAAVNVVRLDQLAASRANSRVVLAGPMYQCPLFDVIHPTSVGRMVLGDMLGDVTREVEKTGAFVPLRPATVTRAGAVITVTFDVPFGPITRDVDWVPAVTNWGFAYSDSTSSATISSVAITGPATLQITLNTTPSGASQRLKYGLDAGADLTGWSRSRANLYSQSPTPSAFKRLGFNVPPYVRHYCVGFDMEIL